MNRTTVSDCCFRERERERERGGVKRAGKIFPWFSLKISSSLMIFYCANSETGGSEVLFSPSSKGQDFQSGTPPPPPSPPPPHPPEWKTRHNSVPASCKARTREPLAATQIIGSGVTYFIICRPTKEPAFATSNARKLGREFGEIMLNGPVR